MITEREQMMVTRDDEMGLGSDSGCDNVIVVGIAWYDAGYFHRRHADDERRIEREGQVDRRLLSDQSRGKMFAPQHSAQFGE